MAIKIELTVMLPGTLLVSLLVLLIRSKFPKN